MTDTRAPSRGATTPMEHLRSGLAPREVALAWLEDANEALAARDAVMCARLFAADGWLRDRLTLTWDLRTFRGRAAIEQVFADRVASTALAELVLDERLEPSLVDGGSLGRWVQASFWFTTAVGRGRGLARLIQPEVGPPVAWTVVLDLKELDGHEESIGHRRPIGVEHGATRTGVNWLDRRRAEQSFEDAEPAVVVLGAGQSGLAVAARLGRLGVPTLVLERHARVGDPWRNRYHSLVLHDPIWANHLPYLSFPEAWPRFIAKDKLAGWLESYAETMEINVWTRATAGQATYDARTATWVLPVTRGDGGVRVVRPRHLIFATGHSGLPQVPDIEGRDEFTGRVRHSSEYHGADGMHGRKVLVVGAGNSSHDICHDLADAGADVTMLQRSKTYVHSSSNAFAVLQAGIFDQGGPATEDADHLANSMPLPVLFDLQARHLTPQVRERDAELRAGLRRAGFNLEESSSLVELYFKRGGGYYIDVGASSAIVAGKIRVRSGVGLERMTQSGVVFTDGAAERFDDVIFATGYGSMTDVATSVVDDEVMRDLRPVWGLDEHDEPSGMWGPSGHPGLWFMGGNLALVRHFSLTLALQVKACEEGLLDRYPRDVDANIDCLQRRHAKETASAGS